jgi:hypothetical protein
MKNELRYYLVLRIGTDKPKQLIEITLGYRFRYEIVNYLKLARNLIDAGEAAQINALKGRLLFAEGIDQQTGLSIAKHEA